MLLLARTLRGRAHRFRDHLDHLLDRSDAGDRLLGKGKGPRYGADQLAIDINRAATHSGDHAGLFKRTAGKPRQDQVLLGGNGVLEDAENLDLELINPVAFEDGAAHSLQSRVDLVERKKLHAVLARGAGRGQEQACNRSDPPSMSHRESRPDAGNNLV